MGWPAALKCSAAGLRRNGARVEDPIPRSIAHFGGEGSTAYSTAPRGLIRSVTPALLLLSSVIVVPHALQVPPSIDEGLLGGAAILRLLVRCILVLLFGGHCRPFLLFQ